MNTHWKDLCSRWSSNTLETWWEQLTHWKRPWCWERLKVGGERDDRGWDDWMVSPIQWTWTWENSSRWWGTGKPVILQSLELQSQTWLGDWTTTTSGKHLLLKFCSNAHWCKSCFEICNFNQEILLLLLSCSVVSDSLWSHGLQHAVPVHHQLPDPAWTYVHQVGDPT